MFLAFPARNRIIPREGKTAKGYPPKASYRKVVAVRRGMNRFARAVRPIDGFRRFQGLSAAGSRAGHDRPAPNTQGGPESLQAVGPSTLSRIQLAIWLSGFSSFCKVTIRAKGEAMPAAWRSEMSTSSFTTMPLRR